MPVTPKDAAAIILLRDRKDPKMFWVKRNPKLMFMGGFHAFPGGQLDKEDSTVAVTDFEESDDASMRACAAREMFEEAGVLIARGAEQLSADRISEKRRALGAKEKSFKEILEEDDLEIDGAALEGAGRWVTPAFAPRRFDTWFFLAWLPEGQEPEIEPGELVAGEWVRPADALDMWKRGDIIMAPPTLHIIKTLAKNADRSEDIPSALTSIPEARRGAVVRIEFKPGIFLFPVETRTLPPATHTNCYVMGGREMIILDPASPYEKDRLALDSFIDSLIAEGRKMREIFITHHHPDHVGGVDYLRNRLGIGVAAHPLTAERLAGTVTVDRYIEDNEIIELDGDPSLRLRVLHTPGHTRGHICFYEEKTGAIITGDLIVGVGTVVIDPPEGNMQHYFDSLGRLLTLPKLSSLFPAHGPAIGSAQHKIEEYIDHRLMRENKILDAVRAGCAATTDIVEAAYTDVSPSLYWLAERSTVAHLEKLEAEGRVRRYDGSHYRIA